MKKLLTGAVVGALMLAGSPALAAEEWEGEVIPWSAAGTYHAGAEQLEDPQAILAGLMDLEDSEIPKAAATGGTMYGYTYSLPEGIELTLPSADEFRRALLVETGSWTVAPKGTQTADVTVRLSGSRVAIGFSQRDQVILKSAAASTILTAAVCAIPGVGWAACAVVGFAVSVAASYVIRKGICSNGRTLWWYDVRGGSTIQCRSTRPF